MKKENKIEELNYENFNIFVLGYDLLQSELNDRELDVDTAFYVCHQVYNDFLLSDYNDETKSEYECLDGFINNQNCNYIDNILNDYFTSTKIEIPKEEPEQVLYLLSGWTEDMHYVTVWNSEEVWIDTPDEKNWENLLKQFNYFCNRANSLGYYANYNWCVSLRKLKVCKNGSTCPSSLVLKMNKELYKDFKSIIDFPITPNFNENLTVLDDEDKHDRYELVNWRDELYYDKNGFAPQFETCADAWEYIFQNNLIK